MSVKLTYHQEGDYLIPDLVAPEDIPAGIWGIRRRDYLKRHRNGICTGMLLSGKLNAHLAEIDRQATEMFEQLTRQMAARAGRDKEQRIRATTAPIKNETSRVLFFMVSTSIQSM